VERLGTAAKDLDPFGSDKLINAVLIRKTRFSDTSLIVTWFTDQQGKIRTIAKGALRPVSPFSGKLDLFFHCELLVAFSRRSDLHALREVALREPFGEIRLTYAKMLAASYFAALVDEVTEPDHPVPELYSLLLRGFRYLKTQPLNRRALAFFEYELCRILGVATTDVDSSANQLLAVFGRLPDSRRELLARM
jgi:DNA repair protein RecO (recombination protein O)